MWTNYNGSNPLDKALKTQERLMIIGLIACLVVVLVAIAEAAYHIHSLGLF
jgi:hypothetical protein